MMLSKWERRLCNQERCLPRQLPSWMTKICNKMLNIAMHVMVAFYLKLSGISVFAILLSSPPGSCFQADACLLLLALLRLTIASQIPARGLDGPAETKNIGGWEPGEQRDRANKAGQGQIKGAWRTTRVGWHCYRRDSEEGREGGYRQ